MSNVTTEAQDNTRPVKRAFESVKKRDFRDIETIIDPVLAGNAKRLMERIHSAFPDLDVTLDDVITAGDKVVTRWTARGTHTGEGTMPGFGHVKPTGKHATIRGITIHRIKNGKIVETWGVTEKLEAMMELGLVGEGRR